MPKTTSKKEKCERCGRRVEIYSTGEELNHGEPCIGGPVGVDQPQSEEGAPQAP